MCVDFNQESGLGHLSRAQTFYEAALKFSASIFLSCETNPNQILQDLGFLLKTKFLDPKEIKHQAFDVLYVDTYSEEKFEEIRTIKSSIKVVLLDSNFKKELPDWPDIIIDLERIFSRETFVHQKYIFGMLCIREDLESASKRNKIRPKNQNIRKKVIVNFGGSSKTQNFLSKLHDMYSIHTDIDFRVYCNFEVLLQQKVLRSNNVVLTELNSSYLTELNNCDLLVTASGTSFLEGLYLGLPIVVFNIFENAQQNYLHFRRHEKVLFAGEISDLASDWIALVKKKLDEVVTSENGNNYVGPVRVIRPRDIYRLIFLTL